jgi:hypothetical protein
VNGLFRKSDTIDKYVDLYLTMLSQVLLKKQTLREAALEAASKIDFDIETSVELANEKAGEITDFSQYVGGDGSDPMAPCTPEKNFPALLHFLMRYPDPK